LQTSGSSVITDNARDDHASNQIFEDDSPFTPGQGHRAAIDQLLRDPLGVVFCNTTYTE
jgi:hypothetical protein